MKLLFIKKYILLGSIVIFAFAIVSWVITINEKLPSLWFYVDEWWVIRAMASPSIDYLVPFNEHLTLLPLLSYKTLSSLFAMDSYTPYFVAMIIPLILSSLLFAFILKRYFRTPLWIIFLVSALYLVNGAGAPSLIWAFQIGVTLQVLFFSLIIAISMHNTKSNSNLRRLKLPLLSLVLVASMMTSGAFPLLLLTFLLMNLKKIRLIEIVFTAAPSVTLFLGWYLTYGLKYPGQPLGVMHHPELIWEIPRFFIGMLLFSVNTFSPSSYLNVLFFLLFAIGIVLAQKEERRIYFTCIAVQVTFALMTTWNRLSLGFPLTSSGHYQYMESAFLLLPVCISIARLLEIKLDENYLLKYLSIVVFSVLACNVYFSGIKYESMISWRAEVDSSIKKEFSMACQGLIPASDVGNGARQYGFNIYAGQVDEKLVAELQNNQLLLLTCKKN